VIYDFPFESRYIEMSGSKMRYVDEGEGPAIVLLHGNPTWSYYYRNLIAVLSRNFRVIAIDHMGCGLSDKPDKYSYTLAKHIENLTILIDFLKLTSLSLVVHDCGGAIGFGYATRFLDKIDSIVVLNTAAFRSQRIPLRIQVCRWPIIGELIVRGLNGFAWPATFMAVQKKMSKKIARSYLHPYDSWKNRIAVYGFVKDIPLDKSHVSYETLVSIEKRLPELKERKISMLVVWGGKDFCFNDHFYEQWQHYFPDASYHYLQDCGHYILEDGHTIVEPLIEDFFTDTVLK
jgi:pimeloyl-ACP methyl ester carboxylesterase